MGERSASVDQLRRVGSWGTSTATNLLTEFRSFALKGNVVDLAIGVIIGAAFAKIVDSLVKHILMPLVSLLFPTDQNYTAWKLVVSGKEIPYGLFLGEVVNFLILAVALFFFVVKFLGWAVRRREAQAIAPVPPPMPTREQELLSEIRDVLRARTI